MGNNKSIQFFCSAYSQIVYHLLLDKISYNLTYKNKYIYKYSRGEDRTCCRRDTADKYNSRRTDIRMDGWRDVHIDGQTERTLGLRAMINIS